MQAQFGVRNAKAFFRSLEKQGQKAQKAAQTAMKVEGFSKMKTLRKEISSGAPGGRRFVPLSVIGAYSGRPYSRNPLSKLGGAIRYLIEGRGRKLKFVFGFITKKSSKSWVRMAEFHQKGGTISYTSRARRYLAIWGSTLNKAATDTGDRRYFYLKDETTTGQVPARPIINPFWSRYMPEARKNIQRNFKRKLRGERI